MRKIEVVCKYWPFFMRKTKAITLYPFIFYRETPDLATQIHEAEHIKQIEEEKDKYGRVEGWFRFYGSYLWETVKKGVGLAKFKNPIKGFGEIFSKGYWANKYEVEARKAEDKADK